VPWCGWTATTRTGAVIADLDDFFFVMRGKDYAVRPRKRAASVAPAKARSTNSFSPVSRKMGSPPPMLWHSICIVVLLNQC
jgi:hypothetical protein